MGGRLAIVAVAGLLAGCVYGLDRPAADGGTDAASGGDAGAPELDPTAAAFIIDTTEPAGPLAICDFTGDGQPDIVIALPGAPGPFGEAQPAFGQVVVLAGPAYGRLDGDDQQRMALERAASVLRMYGAAAGDQLGESLRCGDVDGDAHDDLVVGAPRALGGRGQVYVVRGGPSVGRVLDLSDGQTSDTTVSGLRAGDALGTALALMDGLTDSAFASLVIGAPGFDGVDDDRDESGAVFVLLGRAQLAEQVQLKAQPDGESVLWVGAATGNRLGSALASGTLRATGDAETAEGLAATAAGFTKDACDGCGAVHVVHPTSLRGGTVLDPQTDAWRGATVIGTEATSGFGASLVIGDFLGADGAGELIIAAPQEDRRGAVYLFDGAELDAQPPPHLSVAEADFRVAFFGATDSAFGQPVGVAPRSGTAVDLLIGAPASRATRGALYLIEARPGYQPSEVIDIAETPTEPTLVVAGSDPGDRLGAHFASGQLNQQVDNRGDLLIADAEGHVYGVIAP